MAIRKVAHKKHSNPKRKRPSARRKTHNPSHRAKSRAHRRKRNPAAKSAMRMDNPGKKRRKSHRRRHANPSYRAKHARRHRNPEQIAGKFDLAAIAKDALYIGGPGLLTVAFVDQIGFVKELQNAKDKDGKPETMKNMLGKALPGLSYAALGAAVYFGSKSTAAKRWGKMAGLGGAIVAVVDAGRAGVGDQIAKAVPSLAKLGVTPAVAGTWLPGPRQAVGALARNVVPATHGTWLPGPSQAAPAPAQLVAQQAPARAPSMGALQSNLVPNKPRF